MTEESRQVLLIEDNRDDIFLMQRAVKKSGVPWNIQIVRDGEEARDFFAGHGKFADRSAYPLPSLVFLDLKLPYMDGFDVLACIQNGAEEIPVIVLTSSPEERDRNRAFELGARAYLTKPPTEELLRKIEAGDWAGTAASNARVY